MVRLLREVALTRVVVLVITVRLLDVLTGMRVRLIIVVDPGVLIRVIIVRITHGIIKVK